MTQDKQAAIDLTQLPEPVAYGAALAALETLRGYAATVIEDHSKDSYVGRLGQRPQDVAEMWAKSLHDIDVKAFLDEAIDESHPPAQPAASLPDVAMPEQIEKARELVESLRSNHQMEIWSWDDLLIAADMIEKLAAQPAEGCTTCNSSGIVGFPPDQYESCPECTPAEGSAQVALQACSPEGDPWQEVSAADFFKAHANGYEVSVCVHSPGKNSIRMKVAAPERSDTPEPIYLVRYSGASGGWREASEEAYHLFSEGNRRILFATPTAASKALDAAAPAELVHQVELDPEQGTWLDVKESEVPTWQRKKFIVRTLASFDGDKQGAQSGMGSFNRSGRMPAI